MEIKLASGTFYGNRSNVTELRDMNLTAMSYPPGLRTPLHSHEHAYFSLILQGSHTGIYQGRSRRFTTSTLIMHPLGEAHSQHYEKSGQRSFIIALGPGLLARARHHSTAIDQPAAFHSGSIPLLAKKLYLEYAFWDEVSELAAEGLTLELIAALSRIDSSNLDGKPPRWLEQVKELLHDRFRDRLKLDDVAETVGVHPVYLARIFRRYYRSTIGDYIRRLRVELASRELATSDKSLVQIALAAGFSAQSHFSTCFKRQTGLTPSQYRSTIRSR